MSDKVTGTAVIDRRGNECRGGCEDLHVACRCANGKLLHCDIPVYEKGKPKTLSNQWQYEVAGDILNITPSLNWMNVFHNSFSWSVKFVEFDADKYPSPRVQLKELNGIPLS